MLVKIKFATMSKSNKLTKESKELLEEFIGESVSCEALKITDDGAESLSWRETFDTVKAIDPEYVLVEESPLVRIHSNDWYVVDLGQFMEVFPNLEYTVKAMPKAARQNVSNVVNLVEELTAKLENLGNSFNDAVEFNQKCEVHVPNLGLMNINRLAYANDKCTEELQELLYKGWRILAICPQPDQRRPDYILGMNVVDANEYVTVQQF